MVPYKHRYQTRDPISSGVFITHLEIAMDKVSTEEQGILMHGMRFRLKKMKGR